MSVNALPLADVCLSRRLERAEGLANARFVEGRVSLFPESRSEWLDVSGTYAMFDGAESPLTQTFGLGVFAAASEEDLDRIERFFAERHARVYHEVSPMADKALLPLLNNRGYQPVELTSVMFRPLSRETLSSGAVNEHLAVRLISSSEHELWAQTSAAGWSEYTEFADQILELARIGAARPGALSFLVELDGRPIATGGLFVEGGVALLAGASTIPEARRHGAQSALLEARLRYAVQAGCDLAMMCAEPGSASQRNAQRNGFHIAYTRIKWRLGPE